MLSRSDAEQLLRFVATAASVGGDLPFAPELLLELGRLIEADWVTYHEMDHVHRRPLLYVVRPGDDVDDEVEDDDIADDTWELMNDHPVCRQWREAGRYGALRLSDVSTRREFCRTRFYAECLAPWGVEYELKSRLPSPLWHARTFAFGRTVGRDFTKRDRLVLELLTPHFSRLWHAARTRRLLAEALSELGRADEQGSRGVILLAGGEVEFMSPPADRLLRDFFPAARRGKLPAALTHWLQGGRSRSLLRQRGGRRLVVERTADSLILEETVDEVQLTKREGEVLTWVARGKTNAEIAELLWLAPSTVRKHLENVYAKLGVSTRTAAVARFLGLIEAQAS